MSTIIGIVVAFIVGWLLHQIGMYITYYQGAQKLWTECMKLKTKEDRSVFVNITKDQLEKDEDMKVVLRIFLKKVLKHQHLFNI